MIPSVQSATTCSNTEDLKTLLRELRKTNILLHLELDEVTCRALDAECVEILNDESFGLQELHLTGMACYTGQREFILISEFRPLIFNPNGLSIV